MTVYSVIVRVVADVHGDTPENAARQLCESLAGAGFNAYQTVDVVPSLVQNPQRPILGNNATYYTITPADIGNTVIHTPHGTVDIIDTVGRISHRDIGRRVFWTADDRVIGSVHYSAESDAERSERIAAFLETHNRISIRETIHHGVFYNINIVSGSSVNYAVRQLLSVSPYNAGANGDTATRIATALIDSGHTEHGWARYDLLMDD